MRIRWTTKRCRRSGTNKVIRKCQAASVGHTMRREGLENFTSLRNGKRKTRQGR